MYGETGEEIVTEGRFEKEACLEEDAAMGSS